jgi:glycosyltransferase involved in cell wall biosynthesis
MWREIVHMREWGVPITIFSTRPPPGEVRARHAWAEAAAKETVYLWPAPVGTVASSVLWAKFRHPIGYTKAVWLAATLPVNKKPAIKSLGPLILPAAILAHHCARLGIGWLHSHSCSNSAVLCMMVKRICGIPFSMTLNANLEWWGGAMREKFADADFTDAIAQWLLDQIHREYPNLRPEQTILGRIGVDTRRWIPADNHREGATFRLITIGRLHASKGHDVLLRGIKILRERGADVTLRLCGAGGERESLEKLAAELGIGDRTKFLGSLSEDQLIEQLKASDAFVLASHAEPLGVVYMEAMAMGVPTIGTAAGGVGEIISSGVDGILVRPNSPEEVADAIEGLMKDEGRRRELGKAGREKIVREFDSRLGARKLYERMFGKLPQIKS